MVLRDAFRVLCKLGSSFVALRNAFQVLRLGTSFMALRSTFRGHLESWETKRDGRGGRLSNVGVRGSIRQLLAGVVGLDGFGLDEDRGVAALDVRRRGRDGAGDVARSQNSGGSDDHQGNCCPDDFHDLCFHGSRK